MFDIAGKYKWIDSCTGVELRGQADDSYKCNFCPVSVSRNALTIGQTGKISGKIAGVVEEIPSDKGFALAVDGKGVLTKKTAKLEVLNQERLNELFPGFKIEQFYLQNFVTGEYSYVSIIKKKELDAVVSTFLDAGKRVLTVSLGPFPVSLILSQLNTYGNQLIFNGHQVQYNHETFVWEYYRYIPGLSAKSKIKAGVETLHEEVLLAYATAFQLALYHQLPVICADVEHLSCAVSALAEEKSFKYKSALTGVALLFLLIINSFVFRFFQSENVKLSALVNETTANIENSQQLQIQLKMKEELLASVGGARKVNYAFLTAELGRTVPASVLLNELIINPEAGKQADNGGSVTYSTSQLTIRGSCSSLQQVNEWILTLDEMYWVKQVQLENYGPNQDRSSDEFLIRVKY